MSKQPSPKARDFLFAFLLILSLSIKIYQAAAPERLTHLNRDQIQLISSNPGRYSFVVMGDSRDSVLTFSNLARQVNAEPILFSINLGDLIYDAKLYRYRFLLKQLRQLRKPLVTVAGNHELRGGESARRRYLHYFGRFYYSFVKGDCYFIMMDNADGTIDPQQMTWLKQELEKATGYRYRFVCAHVPLFDPRAGRHYCMSDLPSAKAFNQLLDDYRVTMLFVSHIHAYFRGVWGKTPYIITGGAGATLSQTEPERRFYHYLRVDVSDTGVEYQVIKVKPPRSETLDHFLYQAALFQEGFLTDTLLLLSSLYFLFRFSAKKIRKQRPG